MNWQSQIFPLVCLLIYYTVAMDNIACATQWTNDRWDYLVARDSKKKQFCPWAVPSDSVTARQLGSTQYGMHTLHIAHVSTFQ